MLKIKDNVDLKELEKYGFGFADYSNTEYRKEICGGRRGQYFELWINLKDRYLYGFAEGADGSGEEDFLDNTLYDLIKDGLVEKVDD